MAMSAVMSWLGRPLRLDAREPEPEPRIEPALPVDLPPPPRKLREPMEWTRERLATTDALWGDGFQFPGGESEALRLAKPLGLSAKSSLLLLGVGGGGPACAVAKQLGAWVSGFDTDPALVAAAVDRIPTAPLSKRAQAET